MRRSIALALVLMAGCACKPAPAAPASPPATTTAAAEPRPQPPEPAPEPRPQPPPVAVEGPPAGTGIDTCDEYIGVIAQMETACAGKVPPETFEALRQGRDAMLQSFPDWSTMDAATAESTRQAMTDACGQARDALRQASEALGCPL